MTSSLSVGLHLTETSVSASLGHSEQVSTACTLALCTLKMNMEIQRYFRQDPILINGAAVENTNGGQEKSSSYLL